MTTSWQLSGVELWQLAGWTMLHFLWVGGLIGLATAVCRVIVRRAAPSVRYAVMLGCLCMLGGSPGGIAAWLVVHGFASGVRPDAPMAMDAEIGAQGEAPVAAAANGEALHAPVPQAESPPKSLPRPSRGLPGIVDGRAIEGATLALNSCAQYLPWLWLIGSPLTFVGLTTGLVGAERLRRASRVLADGPIVETGDRLRQAMQITRHVAVAVCERVAAPLLVGILRPIILLPPAALTYWSVDEIEMVLLHELAHVRRWDNLVNLMQRVVESLLFFHPAVWFASSWVRSEREACCDAVVVGQTSQPRAYAELLVALAAQMPRSVLFYPAATSAMAAGPLRARIRRILQLEDDPMLVSGKSFALLTGSFVAAATLAMLYLPAPGQAKESAGADISEVVATGSEISVTKSADQNQAKSDSPSGNARLEIKSQDGATIVADMQDGKLRLTADGDSHDAESAGKLSQAATRAHKFPSLEEQKLTDFALRHLLWELAPIDEKDLSRVKSLGFDGGVAVLNSNGLALSGVGNQTLRAGDVLVGLGVWPTKTLQDINDILNRADLAELNPLKVYVVHFQTVTGREGNIEHVVGSDVVATGRVTVILDGLPCVAPHPEALVVAIPPTPADTPRHSVTAAPMSMLPVPANPSAPMLRAPAPPNPQVPMPTQVLPEAGALRVGGKWLAEGIAADPKITELRQQLMAAETELEIRSSDAGGVESEAVDKLQKQVAELKQSIGEQSQKRETEFSAGQEAALNNAARQAAAAMAKAQVDLERAAREHADVVAKEPMGAVPEELAKQDFDTAKKLEEANRSFEQQQRAVEDVKRQFDKLRRQGEAGTGDAAGEAKQAVEEARREMDEAKREAEDERRQADVERREAEEEAKREQDEARREADEAKREAEVASHGAEQEKREAEQAARAEQAERAEKADHPEHADNQVQGRLETKTLTTADGKQQVQVIYKPRPSADAGDQLNANRKVLEQIHRHLEEMDRQLERTKLQLQVLVKEKEDLVAHANEITEQIEHQSDDQQKP